MPGTKNKPSNPQSTAENPDDGISVEEDKQGQENEKVIKTLCQEMELETPEKKVEESQPAAADEKNEKADEEKENNKIAEEEILKHIYHPEVAEQMAKEIKKKIRKKLKEQLTYFPSDTSLRDDKLISEKRKKKKKKVPILSNTETRYFTLINIKCPLEKHSIIFSFRVITVVSQRKFLDFHMDTLPVQ